MEGEGEPVPNQHRGSKRSQRKRSKKIEQQSAQEELWRKQ